MTGPTCEFIDDPAEEARRRRAETFGDFLHAEVAGAVALLVATLVALLLANSGIGTAFERVWQIEAGFFAGQLHVAQSLLHWIDDALMALFFFVVGLETKREVLVGELSERRKAALPILAALGGMMVGARLLRVERRRPRRARVGRADGDRHRVRARRDGASRRPRVEWPEGVPRRARHRR